MAHDVFSVTNVATASATQIALALFSRSAVPMLLLTSMRTTRAKLCFMSSSLRKTSLLSLLLATTWTASERSRTPYFFLMSSNSKFDACMILLRRRLDEPPTMSLALRYSW
ncbi:hypothetical protein ES703_108633 [subsurface metagenome]